MMNGRFFIQHSAGFTLVELLIAATMFAVLLVGVGSHVRGGLAVWRRATDLEAALQHQRVALEQLERDLANSVLYDPREASDGPDAGLLPKPEFGGASLAWFTVSGSRREPPAVRFVTYGCGANQGETGLWRTSQSIGAARARAPAAPTLLWPGCQQLTIRYAYQAGQGKPLEWHEEWRDPLAALPRLIEVSVDLTEGRVTRVLAVPTGILPAFQPPA